MKAVASRVTEKSDVLLLTAVDMDDSGPYEIAEPRVITALETYTPSCRFTDYNSSLKSLIISRAANSSSETLGRDCFCPGHSTTREI
jgi:myosin-5